MLAVIINIFNSQSISEHTSVNNLKIKKEAGFITHASFHLTGISDLAYPRYSELPSTLCPTFSSRAARSSTSRFTNIQSNFFHAQYNHLSLTFI